MRTELKFVIDDVFPAWCNRAAFVFRSVFSERAEVLALVKQNLNGYATFSQRAEKLCDQAFERYESPSLKKEKGFVYEQGS